MTTDTGMLAKALSDSAVLHVSKDKTRIRRKERLKVEPSSCVDDRTVYVEFLPQQADHEWVKKVFSTVGEVVYVSLPKFRTTGDLKGFGFVEFSNSEIAQKACEMLNNPPDNAPEKAGRFPRFTKQLRHLQKQVSQGSTIAASSEGGSDCESKGTPASKKQRRKRSSTGSSGEWEEMSPIKRPRSSSFGELTSKGKGGKKRTRSGGSVISESDDKVEEVLDVKPETEIEVKDERHNEDKENVVADTESKTIDPSKVTTDVDEDENVQEDKANRKRKRNQGEGVETADESQNTSVEEEHSESKKFRTDSDSTDIDQPPKKLKSIVEIPHVNKDRKEDLTGCGTKLGKRSRSEDAKEDEVDDGGQVVKRVRISDNVEVGNSAKKPKKRNKRKNKEKAGSDIPQLRVIPKHEWLELKKEYLSLQKASMQQLKRSLSEQSKNAQKHVQKTANDSKQPCQQKKDNKLEFVEGVILKVVSEHPTNRRELKESMSTLGNIAYIDITDGDTEGHIRCHDADSASKIAGSTFQNISVSLLEGDSEQLYWQKITSDRDKKWNCHKKSKKRGVQKIIEKAERRTTDTTTKKHTFFED